MEKFYKFRDEQKQKLDNHVFFELISSDKIELKNKLLFIPVMSHFVMNFRDMNKWVIRFSDSDNRFKSVINGGTIEDETHSRLFLEDWRKLHFDDYLKWDASDVIYWLFISPDIECFRKYGVEFMRLCIDDESHPILRYAHSESGETCGNVFFSRISPTADQLAHKMSVSLRYFGSFHLNLENGHVWKSEGVFEQEVLRYDTFQKVKNLSKQMFNIFEGIHNAFYEYTIKYVITKHPPTFPEMVNLEDLGDPPLLGTGKDVKTPQNEGILSYINNYLELISRHAFYEWLKSSKLDPVIKLKTFIPLWIVDIMGYRDINKYVFPYQHNDSPGEKLISSYVLHLSEHSQLFYNDWKTLELNETLRWTASDTMEFIFLNMDMDTHRENLVRFSLCGLKNTDPLIRFWFIMILELSGKAFFSYVGDVARHAEIKYSIKLPYLSGKHSKKEEHDAFNLLYAHFIVEQLTGKQKSTIKEIVDMVFTALLKNLDISYKYSINNLLAAR